MTERLGRVAPGLSALLHYRIAENLQYDFVAGLSVAAVALPVAVAYAELAGFSPVVGLYSSILPLVAYAVFGTSRQLIVNPNAATCAMIAAAVAPDASGNADLYLSLSITLTFFTGLICIVASFFRLGAFADFLSKPIFVGFLNGIAISIFSSVDRVGKLLGFPIDLSGVIPRLFEIFAKLSQTHALTLAVGLGSLAVLFLSANTIERTRTSGHWTSPAPCRHVRSWHCLARRLRSRRKIELRWRRPEIGRKLPAPHSAGCEK